MAEKPKGQRVSFFADVFRNSKRLSDAQFGELMRAGFAFQTEGIRYTGDDVAVGVLFDQMADQHLRYVDYCDQQAQNRHRSPKKDNGNDQPEPTSTNVNQPEPTPLSLSLSDSLSKENNIRGAAAPPPTTTKRASKFVKPTVDEVAAYCRENNYSVDAGTFVDYYSGNGWHVGKNPMKDWRAAVRLWARKGAEHNDGSISSRAPAASEKYAGIGNIL